MDCPRPDIFEYPILTGCSVARSVHVVLPKRVSGSLLYVASVIPARQNSAHLVRGYRTAFSAGRVSNKCVPISEHDLNYAEKPICCGSYLIKHYDDARSALATYGSG